MVRTSFFAIAVVLCRFGCGTAFSQGLPDEITQRMSSIPTLNSNAPGATPSSAAKGSSFRPQGMTGRALSRRDNFGDQLRASRGLSGMENQPALSATSARAAAARQQLRLQQQRQQLALRQGQSTSSFRDARHEMNHTLTIGFALPNAPNASTPLETAASQAIESHFKVVADRLPIANLSIRLQGRTAILTGQTPDDSTRRLATRMVAMEPGVSEVDNQIRLTTSKNTH